MMCLTLPSLERFAAALRQPATLVERGVHVPFTAPALFAARLRASPVKGIELVVANPSGQRNWLVLPWSSALDSCQPSLADRALVAALSGQPPTPLSVRAAARRVTLSGLAGRRARRAAAAPATLGRLRVDHFARALVEWQPHDPFEEDRRRAAAVAERALDAAQAAIVLATSPGMKDRAAWVLDGWDLLAALWQVTGAEQRPAVLRRLAALTPLPSDDMLSWQGCSTLAQTGLAVHPGAERHFVTQPTCEAALAAWFSPP
jgi:hypothetical protein